MTNCVARSCTTTPVAVTVKDGRVTSAWGLSGVVGSDGSFRGTYAAGNVRQTVTGTFTAEGADLSYRNSMGFSIAWEFTPEQHTGGPTPTSIAVATVAGGAVFGTIFGTMRRSRRRRRKPASPPREREWVGLDVEEQARRAAGTEAVRAPWPAPDSLVPKYRPDLVQRYGPLVEEIPIVGVGVKIPRATHDLMFGRSFYLDEQGLDHAVSRARAAGELSLEVLDPGGKVLKQVGPEPTTVGGKILWETAGDLIKKNIGEAGDKIWDVIFGGAHGR